MVKAVVGANWGDEGKGKITDMLAQEADIIVRFQGGANACLLYTSHYKLHVKNVSRGLDTEAEVVQTIRGELVREEHFQVEKAGEIAVDHSAIIVQALLTLKKRL